jgi:hypothetical protein
MIKFNTTSGDVVWVNPSQVIAVQEGATTYGRPPTCALILNGGTHNRLFIQGTVDDTVDALVFANFEGQKK